MSNKSRVDLTDIQNIYDQHLRKYTVYTVINVVSFFGMGMDKSNMLKPCQSNLWDVRIIPTNPKAVFFPVLLCIKKGTDRT